MKHRFVLRMNANRHDITDLQSAEVQDLSSLSLDKKTTMANAVCVLAGIRPNKAKQAA